MQLIDILWSKYLSMRERHARLFAWLGRYSVFILIFLFTCLYCAVSLLKHMNFQSHGWDLGIFDQHVWQLSRFELGFNTVRLVPSLLGDHFHPILIFVAPAYWVWSDARMLLIIQALAVALGALPVYLVVRRRLESRFCALCLVFAYLFFWGTMELIFFDFHPLAFAGPLLALSYYFMDRDKWAGYLLTIPFLLMIKETMALLVFALGVYVFLFRKRRMEGAVTCLVSLGWFYFVTQRMMPELSGGTTYYYFKYYSHLGDNWLEAGKYLLTHPWVFVRELFWPYHKTKLLLFILVPFLCLPFLAPFSIVAVPPLLERLLSNYYPHWEILRHYNAIFAVIFVFCVVEAFPRLHRLLSRRGKVVDYRKMVLALCVVIALIQVPFTLSRSTKTLFNPHFYQLDPRLERTGYDILSAIPSQASVCAQDPVVPHLSHREYIYQFDGNTYGAEYVVLNKFLDCYPLTNRVLVWEIARLYKDPRYTAYRFGYGWVLFVIKPQYDVEGHLEPLPEELLSKVVG